MTFGFSRISKTKCPRNFSGVYLQGHFFNHTACFVSGTFHLLTNRPSVLGADIPCQLRCQELFPESFQNETCYKLYPKYKFFSCFPTIYSPVVWKSFFNEMGVTYVIFHILKDVDWMLFQASGSLLRAGYSLVRFKDCDIAQPLDMKHKYNFFTWSLLLKLHCASFRDVCFD